MIFNNKDLLQYDYFNNYREKYSYSLLYATLTEDIDAVIKLLKQTKDKVYPFNDTLFRYTYYSNDINDELIEKTEDNKYQLNNLFDNSLNISFDNENKFIEFCIDTVSNDIPSFKNMIENLKSYFNNDESFFNYLKNKTTFLTLSLMSSNVSQSVLSFSSEIVKNGYFIKDIFINENEKYEIIDSVFMNHNITIDNLNKFISDILSSSNYINLINYINKECLNHLVLNNSVSIDDFNKVLNHIENQVDFYNMNFVDKLFNKIKSKTTNNNSNSENLDVNTDIKFEKNEMLTQFKVLIKEKI